MKRVAVIDIGSNSVRLVIYGISGSALISLFDEKATCGLGQDLASTGQLEPHAVERALCELHRFAELAADTNLDGFFPFATAAVREASDGAAFVKRAAEQTGLSIDVLSGLDEARYSALGVAGAIPGASGLVGDLGGGSLELVRLIDGAVTDQATLPMGALMRPADADAEETRAWIRQSLASVSWLSEIENGDFYLVGGAWRSFARAHMQQTGHPISVIHEYAMPVDDACALADVIGVMSERSLALMRSVSRKRQAIMPYAANVLAEVSRIVRPGNVIASAHGLREGFVRHAMHLSAGDPLLDYCRYAGAVSARIPPDGAEIVEWLSPLFTGLDSDTWRWVEAACWLSDLAGRDHPDRRAEIAMARGTNIPAVAISHAGRAFLGAALRARYSGAPKNGQNLPEAMHLLTEEQRNLAVRLGVTLRLAHAVSPSGRNLGKTVLSIDDATLTLDGTPGLMSGETIARRFQKVAEIFGRKPVLLSVKAAA